MSLRAARGVGEGEACDRAQFHEAVLEQSNSITKCCRSHKESWHGKATAVKHCESILIIHTYIVVDS